MARVRLRGIYATALTERLRGSHSVVEPSAAIAERFDAGFGTGLAAVEVGDAADRRGVGVTGDPGAVAAVTAELAGVARDALTWPDPAPHGAVFEAEVTDTLGGGAVVDLGPREGYLPYDAADRRVEAGDSLRVQVREAAAPWVDRRPEVATGLEATAGPVTLVRGADDHRADVDDEARATELVRSVDRLSIDVPDGWAIRFEPSAAEADLERLDDALGLAAERAGGVLGALDGGEPPLATAWTWFGRESRFALDAARRSVVSTMPGHHRIKAGGADASPAVDLVEALLGDGEAAALGDGFPFEAVADNFGPGSATGSPSRTASRTADGSRSGSAR